MIPWRASLISVIIFASQAAFAADSVTGKWVGNIAGNDPHVGAVFELKQTGTKVKGTFVWISDSSGNCKRKVEGTYDPKNRVCKLKDVGIISYHPNPDWKFCLIENYELSLNEGGKDMVGKYVSDQCHDNASIKLHKME